MNETDKSAPRYVEQSAEDLRAKALERHLAKQEEDRNSRLHKGEDHAKFAEDFFQKHVSERERSLIRRVVLNAVNDGNMEALVYTFPSEFCTDGGRAINNHESQWPETLQGKAKEVYDLFVQVAQPQGYHLKAMVINFPGGIPGDIGFILNWEAQKSEKA